MSSEIPLADQIITQQRVCEYLQIAPKKLQLMRKAGKIKFIRMGHRTIRFRWRDVWEYLSNQKKQTKPLLSDEEQQFAEMENHYHEWRGGCLD